MAVYTDLDAEALAALLSHYDVGTLTSAKGIAEGVSNSNWLIETATNPAQSQRFILTMFEGRTDIADLPFFLGLLDHLAAAKAPVPRTIHDRAGQTHRLIGDKAVTLIEFLPGVSVSHPTPQAANAVGAALAEIHAAAATFPMQRPNTMGPAMWAHLLTACGPQLADIDPTLPALVSTHLPALTANWPQNLPTGTIHADLFPDNVLMLGAEVTGLIDFYFACTDTLAYDLAVTHAAWSFSPDGTIYRPEIGQALLAGYESKRPLTPAERAAFPLLGQGAAFRFLSTRAYDWLNTPPGALVTRKDPMAFAHRHTFYAANPALFA